MSNDQLKVKSRWNSFLAVKIENWALTTDHLTNEYFPD